jgi:hypothetical protein
VAQWIVEVSRVWLSVLQANKMSLLSYGHEFTVGDGHGESLLDSCGVLYWSAQQHVT